MYVIYKKKKCKALNLKRGKANRGKSKKEKREKVGKG
jgi:hypothetical protein